MNALSRRDLFSASAALAAGGGLAALGVGAAFVVSDAQRLERIRSRLAPTGADRAPPTQAPGAAAPTPTQTPDVAQAAVGPWTYAAFNRAMDVSERPHAITEEQFNAIQARKPAAIERIRTYLADRFGAADENVVRAFESVPREYYHYLYSNWASTAYQAYEAEPKPWAIGHGSVLSDYLGQAYMTQLAAPKPTDVTLEIGTGSGFQSSLLSRVVHSSYTIEIIEPVGRAVARIFAPLGYSNVHSRVGDGYFGWPEVEGGFDTIMLTCVAQYAPPELFRQLKPGGKLIIPIGQPFRRGQVLYVYTKDAEGRVHSRRDVGVFFIPMTGAMQTSPPPAE